MKFLSSSSSIHLPTLPCGSRVLKSCVVLLLAAGMATCGVDIPKEKQSSFETMTVKKSDL